jgi:hypothetical protein
VTLIPDPNAAVMAKLKSQKVTGKAFFDNKSGQLALVQVDQTTEMEINAGGNVIHQTLQQEVTLKRK